MFAESGICWLFLMCYLQNFPVKHFLRHFVDEEIEAWTQGRSRNSGWLSSVLPACAGLILSPGSAGCPPVAWELSEKRAGTEVSKHSRRTYQPTTREICEKGRIPGVVRTAEWRQEPWQPGTGDSMWGRGGGKGGAHRGQMGSWRVGFTIWNMYVACSLGISSGKRDKGAFIFQKKKSGEGIKVSFTMSMKWLCKACGKQRDGG